MQSDHRIVWATYQYDSTHFSGIAIKNFKSDQMHAIGEYRKDWILNSFKQIEETKELLTKVALLKLKGKF